MIQPRDPVHAEESKGEARARLEVPEWLQREAEDIERLARRERRRTLTLRLAIAATFTAGCLIGLRALLALG